MSLFTSEIQVGDRFAFGRYAPEGETEKSPISWTVLAIEPERMLVLSEKILDMQPYHSSQEIIRWEDCDLRRWLNDNFLNSAFSESEQAQIWIPEQLEDPMGDLLWRLFGMETVTAAIQDRIFLLNGTDLDTYYPHEGLFYTGISTVGTEAVERTAGSELCWWLRSSMREYPMAHIVSPCDSVGASRIDGSNHNGVRPAMWIRLEP